ncbi:TetR/AcrR family transcriptional regulator [Levilactobacillus acidifarinae]|uniref:HTH tetR-type domain-containing protein n=1 Tax=Levilactobacillus acidifarinae DSM 19394 = JCM 15949 TaxID=1423715 RepID=A0A0R1LR47_9LACO|nr:TetR/AcrR family transcriptional regulator [Levilactobacillus acidifarinae]KRK94562.1 hypothetical protein FD25_GL000532 [Levilactobacillus acidifarinae DSM 19394]GEO68314.1 hypothetical protein LAC03_02240 [Levilactobacillus acidifarinae]
MTLSSTDEKLHQAYLQLILDYPIYKIKVSQVTQKAGVSRGTFYTHYDSIADLLEDIEFSLLEAIPKTPNLNQTLKNTAVIYDLLIKKLAYLKTKLPVLRALMSDHGDPHFKYELNQYFLPDILEYAKFNQGLALDSLQVTLVNEALNGSRMSILQWWAYHSETLTIEQLAAFLTQYVQSVTSSLKMNSH